MLLGKMEHSHVTRRTLCLVMRSEMTGVRFCWRQATISTVVKESAQNFPWPYTRFKRNKHFRLLVTTVIRLNPGCQAFPDVSPFRTTCICGSVAVMKEILRLQGQHMPQAI